MGTLSANFFIHGYNFPVFSSALALRMIY
jgi:hypothetical protein